jgi:hypothetical protein
MLSKGKWRRRYREPSSVAEAKRIGINAARKGLKTRKILRLLNECGDNPHQAYRFTEKGVEFLRRMTEPEVISPTDIQRPEYSAGCSIGNWSALRRKRIRT